MPIEIKELHIKAVITNREKQTDSTKALSQEDINKLKKEITSEVTDKVLRILRQKSER